MKRELNFNDKDLIETILNKVLNCMSIDDILSDEENDKIYSDNGDFLYSMTDTEIKHLKEILKG